MKRIINFNSKVSNDDIENKLKKYKINGIELKDLVGIQGLTNFSPFEVGLFQGYESELLFDDNKRFVELQFNSNRIKIYKITHSQNSRYFFNLLPYICKFIKSN